MVDREPTSRRIWRIVRTSAGVLLSTTIMFALANIAVALLAPSTELDQQGGASMQRQGRADAVIAQYGMPFFRKIYPGKADREIRQLILEQNQVGFVYKPFIEVGVGARHDPSVNIHPAGFRVVGAEQGPWPPDPEAINVFVFGASILLATGLRDDETIAANLQRQLRARTGHDRINLYTFGVGSIFSTQEIIYLQNLLRDGFRPDLAIFVNDGTEFMFWNGEPASAAFYRDAQRTIVDLRSRIGREQGFGWHLVELARALPVARLIVRMKQERAAASPVTAPIFEPANPPALGQPPEALYARYYEDSPAVTDRGRIDEALARYRVNKLIGESTAAAFGIEPLFFWLPHPLYKYDLALHPFAINDDNRRAHYGYPVMRGYADRHELGTSFVWCADVLERATQPMFLDRVHFNAAGAAAIARCMADGMINSGALDRAIRQKANRAPAPAVEPLAGALVGPLFSAAAKGDHMALPARVTERETLGREGIRLVDDSEGYASVFEDFPVEKGGQSRLYEASIRIKPASSPAVMLVMHFMGGQTRSHTIGIDPQTMSPNNASGLYSIKPAEGGWYRVSLSAITADPQVDRVRVQLYPRHGKAGDRGDVIFGGGELRARAQSSPAAAD